MIRGKYAKWRMIARGEIPEELLLPQRYQSDQPFRINLKEVQGCPIELAGANIASVQPGEGDYGTGFELLILLRMYRVCLARRYLRKYPTRHFGPPFAGRRETEMLDNQMRLKKVRGIHFASMAFCSELSPPFFLLRLEECVDSDCTGASLKTFCYQPVASPLLNGNFAAAHRCPCSRQQTHNCVTQM